MPETPKPMPATPEELRTDRRYMASFAAGSLALLGGSVYAGYAAVTGKIGGAWYLSPAGIVLFGKTTYEAARGVLTINRELRTAEASGEVIAEYPDNEDVPDAVVVEDDERRVEPAVKPVAEGGASGRKEQRESGGDIKTNRKSAQYLHAFFGISTGAPTLRAEHSNQITALARETDPAAFPGRTQTEVSKTISRIAELAKAKKEGEITLFASNAKTPQPSGLSVGIALQKIGFGNPAAKQQYEINADLNDEGVMTTSATIEGKFHMHLSYRYDGTDTKVVLSLIDPEAKPESLPPVYPKRADPDRRRARFHGSELYSPDLMGVSRGRKRGRMPSG